MTFPTTDQNNEETWLDQSEIKCGVGSQCTFSVFSALRAYFNNFGQKLLYLNDHDQNEDIAIESDIDIDSGTDLVI